MKKRTIRILRNTLLILLGLLVLSLAGGYILAKMYKDEILSEVQVAINEKLSGKLEIEDINFTLFNNFPSFSLTLQNPVIRDSMYPVHKAELFRAEKIMLQVRLLRLLQGHISLQSITISNASISLVKMKNGYSNTSIVRKTSAVPKEKSGSSSLSASVHEVIMKNVKFSMVDSIKNKWFRIDFKDVKSDIDNLEDGFAAEVEGNIVFGGLAFNAEKGSYLTDINSMVFLKTRFESKTSTLHIKSSSIEIDNSNYLLRGAFTFSEKPHMHLEIDAARITVMQANKILTQHIASKLAAFEFEKPLLAAIRIDGFLLPGSKPAVDVFFKTDSNVLNMKTKTFSEVNTLGWFQNHVDSTLINDDHNSKVTLVRFHANLGGIPIRSKININDLIDPSLQMKATIDMALEDANGIADSSKFTFNGGNLSMSLSYDGKLLNNVDTVTNTFLASVNGNIKIDEADFYYVPRGFHFAKLNADMIFGDSLLSINALNFEVNGNALSITGEVLQFIPFLFVRNQSVSTALNVQTGSLNFDHFKAGNQPSQQKAKKTSGKKKKAPQKSINESIDKLINTMEADILLSAEKIISGRFTASNVKGHIIMSDEYVRFKDISMNTSGGTFSLNGSITDLHRSTHRMAISTSIGHADISSLFYSFDNFNQKTITHENLKGSITARADFSTHLKKNYAIDPKSMKGRVILSIKNGSLNNLEGLEKISEYVFKNRDFSKIEFANLKDTITLNGPMLTMTRMLIQSSVVTLYAEGTYGFQGGTDMLVQIPLSNLKKREKDFKNVKVSEDTKLGPTVLLRIKEDKDGKMQIAYDPFKDYYKEKQKAATDSSVVSTPDKKSAATADSTAKKKNKKKN